MIKSWKSSATQRFALSGKGRFSGLDEAKVMARLQLLDAARSMEEIPPLRSVGLHKLSGNRKGE
jgi:proteic killer suppression protein